MTEISNEQNSPANLPNSASQVLRFWRNAEIFNIAQVPFATRVYSVLNPGEAAVYRAPHVIRLHPAEMLPWEPGYPDASFSRAPAGKAWIHVVYLGVRPMRDWAQAVLEAFRGSQELEEDDLERITGDGCLAAFAVDANGRALENSYVCASFGVGIERLKKNGNLEGLTAELRSRTEAFDLRRNTAGAIPTASVEGAGAPQPRVQSTGAPGNSKTPPSTSKALGHEDIRDELLHVLNPFGESIRDGERCAIVKSMLRTVKDEGEESRDDGDRSEPEIQFMNSFYLNDLDRLIVQADEGESFGAALESYLGPGCEVSLRRDLLTQNNAMTECVSPAKMPQGRWPGKRQHSLMLAQQAAVGEICNRLGTATGSGLISVNGPPGTGKTTLLCDVIADVVVQRAIRLAELTTPSDLFTKSTTIGGLTVHPIKTAIVGGTGIVVASNNNAAVENITQTLPARGKIANDEHPDAGYFAAVAAKVFKAFKIKKKACALVAVALGNKTNRETFAKAFFNEQSLKADADGACDIRTLLSASDSTVALASWHVAQATFKALLAKVQGMQAHLTQAEAAMVRLPFAGARLKRAHEDLVVMQENEKVLRAARSLKAEEARAATARVNAQLNQAAREEQTTEIEARRSSDQLADAEATDPPGLAAHCLRLFGIQTTKMRVWLEATGFARAKRMRCDEAWQKARERKDTLERNASKAQEELQTLQDRKRTEEAAADKAINEASEKLQQMWQQDRADRARLAKIAADGVKVPDDAFYTRPTHQRHVSSVWVTPEFQLLRAQLMVAALQLHEATLMACSTQSIENFKAVHAMLTDSSPEPIGEADRTALWDMLFFTVPVVSTTLASFDRLFAGVGQEGLGWLLIDEAGQATPQSIAGALWRSKRAVIVGDPLQVEPVMTVPGAVIAGLRKHQGVDACWSPSQASAQTLADRTMSLGAYIGPVSAPAGAAGTDAADDDANSGAGQRVCGTAGVWTGMPLRAHRRCIEPMFGVANRIAYQGQMVQANTLPDTFECMLGQSAWLDVRTTEGTGQVIDGEINALADLLELLRDQWPLNAEGASASVYVISPFKKVAYACAGVIKRAGLNKDHPHACGTVHKFQGQEAEVVFLVLGSASGKEGAGSRKWASSKPNILNVALTRAKLRVYVIGNSEDWGQCAGFSELLIEMKAAGRLISARNFYDHLIQRRALTK